MFLKNLRRSMILFFVHHLEKRWNATDAFAIGRMKSQISYDMNAYNIEEEGFRDGTVEWWFHLSNGT